MKDVPEYKSPFLLPVCVSPEDYRMSRLSHSERLNCPAHSVSRWNDWYVNREAFANPDSTEWQRSVFLEQMLRHVTESCPPDAPAARAARSAVSSAEYYKVAALACLAALLGILLILLA